jgi:hypothetical protein
MQDAASDIHPKAVSDLTTKTIELIMAVEKLGERLLAHAFAVRTLAFSIYPTFAKRLQRLNHEAGDCHHSKTVCMVANSGCNWVDITLGKTET